MSYLNMRRITSICLSITVCAVILLCNAATPSAGRDSAIPADVYATYGVHNDAYAKDCAFPNCTYERGKDEPANPEYPPYWTSRWTMYRVFNKYQKFPPPYDRKPPPGLTAGTDYQTSWGTTYYDSTWSGPSGRGAMEENYDQFCLPIFPFPNNYSCSFISLGAIAFFVTYDDRPSWMPPVCLFSPSNHPPERDFIKHLPYARQDGERLDGKVYGYSFWVGTNGKPIQTGVSPDRTADQAIMFGYAFDAAPTPDRVNKTVAAYRHPQSFYFSGVPYMPQLPLPNAPIVSQNYTDFAMVKPDPATTWSKVSGLDPKTLPQCQLFNPPATAAAGRAPAAVGAATVPTWGTLGK
jgi:hypothetical protein